MAEETIKEIIAVEKEIQAKITEEGDKIAQWMSDQEAAIAHELNMGMKALCQKQTEEEEAMRTRIKERTSAILTSAEQEADRCHELSRQELESHIRRHLRKTLPD